MTTGTNTPLTRSTSRWIGAFFACADSTRRTMRASVDSAPTAVVRTTSSPSALTEPPVTRSPACLCDRQALAGDQRLVDLARAFHDHAVDRRCVRRGAPRPGRRRAPAAIGTSLSCAVAAHARGLGAQRVEGADRLGGLALGARFEPLAQQHQRDDDGRRLEVQVRHAVCAVAQQQVDAQPVGRRGAERPPAGPCCRRRPERPSSPPGRSARRARTAPAWRAASCSQPSSIHIVAEQQCRPSAAPAAADSAAATAIGHQGAPGFAGAAPASSAAPAARISTPGSRPCRPQRPAGPRRRAARHAHFGRFGRQVDLGRQHAGHLS